MGLGGVLEHRKRIQNRSVETARRRRDGGGWVGGVHVENQMMPAPGTSMMAAARPVQIPPSVDVETYHENYDSEQNHNRAQHNLAAQCIARGRIVCRPILGVGTAVFHSPI